jgi:hypothetical protein
MTAKSGHIVVTPGSKKPYKVVLDQEEKGDEPRILEVEVSTVREGEALIKRVTPPPPPAPETIDDWHN